MSWLPPGTVTFLFTDIEGSTRLWEEHPDAMQGALARHDKLLRAAIESHGGYVVKTTGDISMLRSRRRAVGRRSEEEEEEEEEEVLAWSHHGARSSRWSW